MTDLWKDLLGCLDLRETEPGTCFEGSNQRLTYHRLFGGQLLAQFVRAASLVCPDKTIKSMHALFPREGRSDEPVRYEVERAHDGGTFATLTIRARQQKGIIATASVSMHTVEEGLDHQTIFRVPELPGRAHQVTFDLIPWDTRSTDDLDARTVETAEFDLWMRTPKTEPALTTALTAYATDLTLIGTALRQVEGVCQQDAGTAFKSAVTSHSLWFHRPFRTDDWLLLRQHSPVLAHGRCFGRGDVLTAAGFLVASYAQEAMLRFL
ncbi:acyl-CoA thioesterase [Catenulispora rubra]|uniref:acyl-CoA thioesterase n=1 Tax=Catenulispora rubra TaxID=280293 RepID=UPI001891F8C8|nr:acyl-CoA thioesterase domain-containing protein [Catenulispora rubra]